jgi:aspartate kinase
LSKIQIGGIVQHSNLILFVLEGKIAENLSANLLSALGEKNINIQVIVRNISQTGIEVVSFCIENEHYYQTLDTLDYLKQTYNIEYIREEHAVSNLGIYGPDFRIRSGLAGKFLEVMAQAGINIRVISTSISTFSVIIPTSQLEIARSAIECHFEIP